MDSEKDDLQYKDLIKDLNQLQEVNAPKNFEADLMRKINSGDLGKEKINTGFWDSFISPARLIPIGVLAAAMFIMFIMIQNKPNISDDPLLAAPRERTDLISSNDISIEDFVKERKEISNSLKKDKSESDQKDSDEKGTKPFANNSLKSEGLASSSRSLNGAVLQGHLNAPAAKASFAISKSGLNFRQVNLSKEEKQEVEQLREKLLNSYQKQ